MPKRKPSRAADKLRPIVRKVSVEFTLTDESLKELGDHLRVRGMWASAGMDTLTTADHICFAVFAKARADIPNDGGEGRAASARTTPPPCSPSGDRP